MMTAPQHHMYCLVTAVDHQRSHCSCVSLRKKQDNLTLETQPGSELQSLIIGNLSHRTSIGSILAEATLPERQHGCVVLNGC